MEDIKPINKDLSYYTCGGCKQICFSYHICESCNIGMCVNCTRNIKDKPENYCSDCYYTNPKLMVEVSIS